MDAVANFNSLFASKPPITLAKDWFIVRHFANSVSVSVYTYARVDIALCYV